MSGSETNQAKDRQAREAKRDYACIHPRPDAATALQQLPTWIEDYNEVNPHKGLRMRLPREFIRSQSQPAPCPV